MKQTATVLRLLGDDVAEVAVVRQSACAHDCADCAGCGAKPGRIIVQAKCDCPVSPGDKVELYSGNSVLGYAALVYLIPLLLFLFGYIAAPFPSELIRFVFGSAGFALGLIPAVLCDRRVRGRKAAMYRILRKMM